MSSKEIIKALRRGLFSNELLQISADTIEKFESVINRLQAENKQKETDISNKSFEITRLKGEIFAITSERDAYEHILETAKTEAYKEFAERLKETFPKDDFLRSTKQISKDIDNLLKEMVSKQRKEDGKNDLDD